MGLDNPLHIAFLVLVLLLLFGAKRIPGMARDLGTGMREFKEGILPGSSPPETAPVVGQQSQSPPAAQQPLQSVAPVAETQPPPQQQSL
jgi:sec-independent protein translocase protein TatA